MYCYSFWIRGKDLPEIDIENIRSLTEQYNSHDLDSYIFLSYWGTNRGRLDALSRRPLEKKNFEAFGRTLHADIDGRTCVFGEVTLKELMKRIRFARQYGYLQADTDILSRFDICDFRFHRSQYRKKIRHGQDDPD